MEAFIKGVTGRLLWAEADPNTRFKYTVWFDYTRMLVNQIREGDLVAVPNFATDSTGIKYSILQLTNVMPMHYALGTDIKDLKGFPGFVMQAAKSASADWTEQEKESYEDTTKIVCEAIPINLEYDENNSKEFIQSEKAMAMVGKDVYLLNLDLVEKIFNKGINKEMENVIEVGNLIRDKNIKILIRTDDLIKTHFGIFGFTGVGKSNLISTLVSNLLSKNNPTKILLFDLMDEYNGLLIDQLLSHDGIIICLGEDTLMKPVFDYINGPTMNKLDLAIDTFLKNILLPKGLKGEKQKFRPLIKRLLENGKIKIIDEKYIKTVNDFLNEYWQELLGRFGASKKGKLNKMKEDIFDKYLKEELTPKLAKELIDKLGFGDISLTSTSSVQDIITDSELRDRLNYTIIEPLKKIALSDKIQISENAKITIQKIIEDLNDETKSNLYIIISHDSERVKQFAYNIGNYLFSVRRHTGRISPTVLFIFDEADQFIPASTRTDNEQKSKYIIEMLTRRGRKFGIGVGIATQRSAYLDTNIMGQLHTYFISKLPREYDRKVVGEAFSLSIDQFIQTFKFQKGQWLLVSHDATGIDMPIPIQTYNAEERIRNFLLKSL